MKTIVISLDDYVRFQEPGFTHPSPHDKIVVDIDIYIRSQNPSLTRLWSVAGLINNMRYE